MKITLDNNGTINWFKREFTEAEQKLGIGHACRRCKCNLTTSFDTLCTVVDVSDEDKAILLDMITRHLMEVQLKFSHDIVAQNRKLNLSLRSDFFSEFEEKFRKNFTITGEMELEPPTGLRDATNQETVIAIQEGLKAYKDTDKIEYSFQDVKSPSGLRFGVNFLQMINLTLPLSLKVKLKLCFETHEDTDTPPHADFRYQINRKILNDGIATDVTIIASNGAQIKCHKSFLIAHSSMLEGMLNIEMQEAITGVIQMKTVSERGVRALLAYMYYWDLKEVSSNCKIAIELYKAADYYIIPRLDMDIRNLLLRKPAVWFSVDVALQLFVFAHRLDRAQLKLAALQAILINFEELKSNASYQELLNTDPMTAAEICNELLELRSSLEANRTADRNEGGAGASGANENVTNDGGNSGSATGAGVNRYNLRSRGPPPLYQD